eukprot:TRINITY_DN11138_c0_g2_i1.p1 TRINITY_DN11138_c0_g2~~TRINITY_DN11138_c0_g2_i1.p1  ORF type:complete len:304 (+),score=39.94 TRINITY_DN11138_c0_g2_i1:27-914(+)
MLLQKFHLPFLPCVIAITTIAPYFLECGDEWALRHLKVRPKLVSWTLFEQPEHEPDRLAVEAVVRNDPSLPACSAAVNLTLYGLLDGPERRATFASDTAERPCEWRLRFEAVPGYRLQPGEYQLTVRMVYVNGDAPAMPFSACLRRTGRFNRTTAHRQLTTAAAPETTTTLVAAQMLPPKHSFADSCCYLCTKHPNCTEWAFRTDSKKCFLNPPPIKRGMWKVGVTMSPKLATHLLSAWHTHGDMSLYGPRAAGNKTKCIGRDVAFRVNVTVAYIAPSGVRRLLESDSAQVLSAA